jgi:hypothetical protein
MNTPRARCYKNIVENIFSNNIIFPYLYGKLLSEPGSNQQKVFTKRFEWCVMSLSTRIDQSWTK